MAKEQNNIKLVAIISIAALLIVAIGLLFYFVKGYLSNYPAYSFNYPVTYVQGGTFRMGSNHGEDDEKPEHSVSVGSFYIGKFEVTQKRWVEIMGTNPSSYKGCDNCPVENVSWNDVQEFISKLNKKTGKTYRLPTEVEWEYAAKGGNKSKGYEYCGSNNVDEVAWHADNSSRKTHPIGQKKANELGIYDMSGNVWEWCSNLFKVYPRSNVVIDQKTDTWRVFRGGSWYHDSSYCRLTFRAYNNEHDNFNGFRLVLVR